MWFKPVLTRAAAINLLGSTSTAFAALPYARTCGRVVGSVVVLGARRHTRPRNVCVETARPVVGEPNTTTKSPKAVTTTAMTPLTVVLHVRADCALTSSTSGSRHSRVSEHSDGHGTHARNAVG